MSVETGPLSSSFLTGLVMIPEIVLVIFAFIALSFFCVMAFSIICYLVLPVSFKVDADTPETFVLHITVYLTLGELMTISPVMERMELGWLQSALTIGIFVGGGAFGLVITVVIPGAAGMALGRWLGRALECRLSSREME